MWSAREESLMTMTVAVSTNSTEPNRHGAIIVRKGLPISTGWNKDKTHPAAVVYYSNCIHAELAAIIGVNGQELKGTDIFVARKMRSAGEPLGMSKPCKQCRKMIENAGIRRVYYTDRDGNWRMERV